MRAMRVVIGKQRYPSTGLRTDLAEPPSLLGAAMPLPLWRLLLEIKRPLGLAIKRPWRVFALYRQHVPSRGA